MKTTAGLSCTTCIEILQEDKRKHNVLQVYFCNSVLIRLPLLLREKNRDSNVKHLFGTAIFRSDCGELRRSFLLLFN